MTVQELADELGVDKQRIRYRLKVLGLQKPGYKVDYDAETCDLIRIGAVKQLHRTCPGFEELLPLSKAIKRGIYIPNTNIINVFANPLQGQVWYKTKSKKLEVHE